MAKILQWVNYNGTSYELDGVAYAVCSTASSTSAKIVDSGNDLNFKLINGAKIVVKFINAITVGTPTLKVGNTAAKYIKYNGSLLQSDTISNNQVCEFVYDSTDDAWLLVGGTGTGSSSTSGDGIGLMGRIITSSDIPTIHEAGWLYVVNTAGTYVGQNCEVGDLILCINSGTTADNDDWVVIQKNVDVALWKGSNTFSDGQLLIADGANGKVRAVAMSPTINFTAGTNLNAPKFKINIGGVDSNEVSINAASTSNMGAVLLNDTPNELDSSTAATPKLVDTAIVNKINTLDVSDTADSTKYVSAVSEADGKISVSRELFNPTVTIANGTALNAPTINISVAGNSATAQSLNLATTSNIGVALLDSALNVNEKTKETTAVTPKGVWTAIGTLDGNITGIPSASKTATSFTEADGIVTATFGDIAINASQITSGTLPVERGGTGQTSIANIQAGKDENGNSITTTYATKTELNNLISATDAMVFKGIVNMPEHLPSTNYQRGWTYKVATAGTYVNQVCEVGDIIICINDYDSTVASINDWAVIQTNVDSSLFKGANTFVDGQMLLADGANGKVKATNINPTLTVGASTGSNTNTIKFSVGGVESSAVALSAASTSNFGETILTNTLSDVEESKAATPKLVSSAITSSINNLDFTDTADSTKFVSAVNESNGIISVTRELFNPLISINSGANSSSTPTVTISVAGNSATSAGMPAASTTSYGVTKLSNTPSSLEESLAATPKLVETAVANTINNLDFTDTADPSKYVSAINQSNGIISVSRESLNPQISISSGATQNDTPTITISIGDDTISANSATSNGLPAASTSSYGVTKLSNATNSQSESLAATPLAVKTVADLASATNTFLNSGSQNQMLVATGNSQAPTWKTVAYTALNTGYTITNSDKLTASVTNNGVLVLTHGIVGITSSGTVDVVTGFNGVVSNSVPNGNEVSY